MNLSEYSKVATRTSSNDMHFNIVNPGVMATVIRSVLLTAPDIDAVKKGLYYGKPQDRLKRWKEHATPTLPDRQDRLQDNNHAIHGVLGMVSESLELLELLHDRVISKQAANREPLTRTEIADELGDVMWYFNLVLHAFGLTFEEVASANIAKLSKRFPAGTFRLEDWEARDKQSEADEMRDTLVA